jgi:hypothetical protein
MSIRFTVLPAFSNCLELCGKKKNFSVNNGLQTMVILKIQAHKEKLP